MIETTQETRTIERRLCDECGAEIRYIPKCTICDGDFCGNHSHRFFVPPYLDSEDTICNDCSDCGDSYEARIEQFMEEIDKVLFEWKQKGLEVRRLKTLI